MPETVELVRDEGFILIRSFDNTTIDEMGKSVADAFDIAGKEGVNRVLVDARDLQSMPDAFQLIDFALTLPVKLRFAVVLSKRVEADVEFLATAARNRARRMQGFRDYDEAIAWLKSTD